MDDQRIVTAMPILMADDDPDDRMLTKDALLENRLSYALHFVEDGEQLLDYLHQRGNYNEVNAPNPALILLDLNMPKMDGREALRHIKNNEEFKRIPVIVLTTSRAEPDVVQSYDLGVNSFISKPDSFDELVAVTRRISEYWFGIVELPKRGQNDRINER